LLSLVYLFSTYYAIVFSAKQLLCYYISMFPLSVCSAGVKPAATTAIGFRWEGRGVLIKFPGGVCARNS